MWLHPPTPSPRISFALPPPSQTACSVMQVTAQGQRDDNTGQLVRTVLQLECGPVFGTARGAERDGEGSKTVLLG